MKKYTTTDKREVMVRAWRLFRANRFGTFATCLKMAWEDVKAIRAAKAEAKVNEPVKTYIEWQAMGREVAHGLTNLFKVVLNDAKTKNGKRVNVFFGYTQTVALGYGD